MSRICIARVPHLPFFKTISSKKIPFVPCNVTGHFPRGRKVKKNFKAHNTFQSVTFSALSVALLEITSEKARPKRNKKKRQHQMHASSIDTTSSKRLYTMQRLESRRQRTRKTLKDARRTTATVAKPTQKEKRRNGATETNKGGRGGGGNALAAPSTVHLFAFFFYTESINVRWLCVRASSHMVSAALLSPPRHLFFFFFCLVCPARHRGSAVKDPLCGRCGEPFSDSSSFSSGSLLSSSSST